MAPVVCVWLPNWPLQRLRHERPKAAGRAARQAIVLFSPAGKRGPRVVTCSSAAAQQGVTIGMPLAEAQALLNATLQREDRPGALFERHDPSADAAALRRLARMCDRFSPHYGIECNGIDFNGMESADSADCVFVEIAGCGHLFGGEAALAEAVAGHFRQLGFQVRVAIAPTLGAAWAAAHCLASQERPRVLVGHDLAGVLEPLPVTALRLPRRTVETLYELGLRTIGQLRALPRGSLPSRLGPKLLQRLDQALGDEPELLVVEHPAEPVEAAWAGEEPLTNRESLRFVCRELIDQLVRQLQPRREGVRQLVCQLKGTMPQGIAAQPIAWRVNLVSPSDSAQHLRGLLELHFERAELPAEVSGVRLAATEIASLAIRQRGLFDVDDADVDNIDAQREISALLDRLSSRLGAAAVGHVLLVPEAQPELSVAHAPVAELGTVRSVSDSLPRCVSLTMRPLRLFTPPRRIEVTGEILRCAQNDGGWQYGEHRILRSWGPERIESGWWRGEPIGRDYFRVEVHTGQHFWIFRCCRRSVWFLHGAFD